MCIGISGFGGLGVACWPLVPEFAGSNPAEAVGFLGRKNPQYVFLRRGSKAVCPMSYFAACKRSLNVPWKSEIQAKFSAIFVAHVVPTFATRSLVAKVGTSKRGGRQWQTTPKNLPCMQRSRATSVA